MMDVLYRSWCTLTNTHIQYDINIFILFLFFLYIHPSIHTQMNRVTHYFKKALILTYISMSVHANTLIDKHTQKYICMDGHLPYPTSQKQQQQVAFYLIEMHLLYFIISFTSILFLFFVFFLFFFVLFFLPTETSSQN